MAKERLQFTAQTTVRCPNCNYRVPVESELEAFQREQHDRRMPGNARLRAMRGAALFSASVREAKRKAKKRG